MFVQKRLHPAGRIVHGATADSRRRNSPAFALRSGTTPWNERSKLSGAYGPSFVPNVVASLDAYWAAQGSAPIAVRRLDGATTADCAVTPIGLEGVPTDDLS